jgi:transcriptional regulator with XRE-family HTH domain
MPRKSPPNTTTPGERIRARREALGLTEQQAAEAASMTQPYWHQLEAGKRVNPTRQTMLAVCRALDATLDELWGE